MIRYLTLVEILDIHHQVTQRSGGAEGIRDLGALESAIAQPRMTFGGEDLYPTIIDKAAVLGFAIVMNHPFVDGGDRIANQRIGDRKAIILLNYKTFFLNFTAQNISS